MNGYELSRAWFDFAFENTKAKVQHTALYLWIVELNNRLGWKKEFGIPTNDTMEGLSIGNKGTYLSALKDLEDWGFIEIVKESKNQYQACIISLCCSKSDTAQVTALDTALQRHDIQHCNGTGNGIGDSIGFSTEPIVKQENQETNKPLNKETIVETAIPTTLIEIIVDESIKTETQTPHPPVPGSPPPSEFDFQTIWELYDKKVGDRIRCEKKWNRLSDKDKRAVLKHIPQYVNSTPDKKYRANLETYLNQKRWLNEIITQADGKPRNTPNTTASVKPQLEKPRLIGGDPIRKNIFGKEEKNG